MWSIFVGRLVKVIFQDGTSSNTLVFTGCDNTGVLFLNDVQAGSTVAVKCREVILDNG